MEATTTKSTFNAPEIKLHFLDYWRIIRIRKTVILAVFLLVAITTTLVTFVLPESFASTVRMKVKKDTPDVGGLGGERPYLPFDPYWVQDQFETIQSKSVLYTVVFSSDLNKRWAEKLKEEGDLRTEITFTLLKRKITVKQSRNTSLIEVKVLSDDKNEAATIANEIAKVYREHRLQARNEMSKGGIKVLQAKLDQRTLEMSNVQAEVNQLKKDLNISDIEAMGSGPMYAQTLEPETLRKIETMRISSQTDFSQLDALYSGLTNLSKTDLRKVILTVVPDAPLSELLSRQALSEQQMAEKLEIYGPENPEVKRIRSVCDTNNIQIDERCAGILGALRVKRDAKKAEVDTLQTEVNSSKNVDITEAIKRRPYFNKKRELENLQYIWEKLNMRVIQEDLEISLPKSGIVEIIDAAEPGRDISR